MIRFARGAEPAALKARRQVALPLAIEAAAQHGTTSKELRDTLKGYDQGKATLHKRQRGKCAFCERKSGLDGNPLEHFRPKKGAIRKDGSIDEECYWWLCWTWENHLFSCNVCNGQARKGNKFWVTTKVAAPVVAPGDTELPASAFDLSGEGALLLDPTDDDPLDHLQWLPLDRRAPRKQWLWGVHGLTPKGRATIEILKLEENLEIIQDHVANHLVARVDTVREHLAAGRSGAAAQAWQTLLNDTVANPKDELRGPTWWALQELLPEAERVAAGLAAVPRPVP